jgi:NAD+ kinase
MYAVGLVLHPRRDSMAAVNAILAWAAQNGTEVLGVADELVRLHCAATPVTPRELGRRSDLLVSLGGDGTMLRAMRLADGQRAPVLGVNLGKLGFLAEVDVPDLAGALTAIDAKDFVLEPRLAVDAIIGDQISTAFNDVAVVRFPGQASASVAVRVAGHPFVSYAADAVVVATPTGSTAYSFSAGGPIVSPAVEALVVTPAAPHSAYNRGLVLSVTDSLVLEILPGSGRLAVEVDGQVAAHVTPGDSIELRPRPGAARVVRLGRTTFYERARRKLRLTDSAEIFPGELTDPHEPHPLTGAGAGALGDPHVMADDPHGMTGSHDLPDLRDAAARPDRAAGSERAATERS